MAANLCGPECKAITCSDSKESISSSGLSSRMKTYMYVEGREGWRGKGGREGREGGKGERKGGKGRRKKGRDSKGMKNCAGTVIVVTMETDQIKS